MNTLAKRTLMYYQIQKLRADKLSITQISLQLGLNWRTVKNYLHMSEQEFSQLSAHQEHQGGELEPFTEFVCQRLKKYPLTSAAQIHDLLKEAFADFPAVSAKTVYNFTMHIRQIFNLPKIQPTREFMVTPLPDYGSLAQVDFGVYHMTDQAGKSQKVWFFCMCLARSRYRFVYFSTRHFTTTLAIVAHEKAFEFFEGITRTVVYDQDRLFISNENLGEYILTDTFSKYHAARKFELHFCKKADPQSKGLIENNVRYIKRNFLYGRIFIDEETLNKEAINWLNRTANALPHATTQKIPAQEWFIEKEYLAPFVSMPAVAVELPLYIVRKNNTISYKGNFYSVPCTTYRGRNTQVKLQELSGTLILFSTADVEIARHQIPMTKGNIVINNNHRRDHSASIDELINQVAALFDQPQTARKWLEQIRRLFPRYIRDHLLAIQKQISLSQPDVVNTSLEFCIANELFSANNFSDIVLANKPVSEPQTMHSPVFKPLTSNKLTQEDLIPKTSDITVYEHLMSV